jgi:hypothetical protein
MPVDAASKPGHRDEPASSFKRLSLQLPFRHAQKGDGAPQRIGRERGLTLTQRTPASDSVGGLGFGHGVEPSCRRASRVERADLRAGAEKLRPTKNRCTRNPS